MYIALSSYIISPIIELNYFEHLHFYFHVFKMYNNIFNLIIKTLIKLNDVILLISSYCFYFMLWVVLLYCIELTYSTRSV